MARTQNVDVTDAIATQLRAGYAFGAEFVELGLGDRSSNPRRPAATTSAVCTATPSCRGRRSRTRSWSASPTSGSAGSPPTRPAPRGRPHGRRRHRHDRRRRRAVRLDPPGEPHRCPAPGRADGGAPARRSTARSRRRTGRRRWRLQHAAVPPTRSCSTGPGSRGAPAGAIRPASRWPVRATSRLVRGGAGARVRVERRQRRRTDDGARRRRAARPRADQAGLAARARAGGRVARPSSRGRWPVGPQPRLGRRPASASTVRPPRTRRPADVSSTNAINTAASANRWRAQAAASRASAGAADAVRPGPAPTLSSVLGFPAEARHRRLVRLATRGRRPRRPARAAAARCPRWPGS